MLWRPLVTGVTESDHSSKDKQKRVLFFFAFCFINLVFLTHLCSDVLFYNRLILRLGKKMTNYSEVIAHLKLKSLVLFQLVKHPTLSCPM